MVVTVPEAGTMVLVVANWKRYTARTLTVHWQRDFFEHRLRHDESLQAKTEYILQNPVRAKLVARAEDWPWVWLPGAAA
jgi:hypothetical protein